MDVRLVVCIDFEDVNSLEEAYRKWRDIIHPTGLPYETSDEFYIDGELGNPKELDEVCVRVIGTSPFSNEKE